MPNHFFRFKQFTVFQQHCAMKVCTDACLFGAWSANYLTDKEKWGNINKVLDIGAGSGLLSLMLAQQIPHIEIDAVEIEPAAAIQAKENFEHSLWKEKLHIETMAIQAFYPDKKYDVIISNPPFFENDLQSENKARNLALHSAHLTLTELLTAAERLLQQDGRLAILLPYHRTTDFEWLAKDAGFFLHRKTLVTQTETHSCFRSMLWFGKNKQDCRQDELSIKDNNNQYTTAFVDLLKDYYLYL